MKTKILAGTALTVAALLAHAAEPAWVTRSNQNAQVLLKVLAKYAPEGAGRLGVDGLDEEITDLSRDQYESARKDGTAAIVELEKRLKSETDSKVKQDLEILITAAQDNQRTAELQRKYFFPYRDVPRQIFFVVQQTLDPRVPAARQQKVLARLDKYAGITQGYRPFAELARERTLERIAADKNLIGPFKGQIEQSISETPALR